MGNEGSLAHTKWDCTRHLVWIPKHGRKILYGECRQEVTGTLRMLAEAKDGQGVRRGERQQGPHPHILTAPAEALGQQGGGVPEGQERLILSGHRPDWRAVTGRDRTFWARGYYAGTVGPDETVIRKYISEQEDAGRTGN